MHTDDLEFIRDPNKWPIYPYLPLKRSRTNAKHTGLLIADGHSLTIYYVNIFDLDETSLLNADKTKYDSHEDMLNDGWMVD